MDYQRSLKLCHRSWKNWDTALIWLESMKNKDIWQDVLLFDCKSNWLMRFMKFCRWHLGACSEDYLPIKRGFEKFFGFVSGGQFYYVHGYNLTNDDEEGNIKCISVVCGQCIWVWPCQINLKKVAKVEPTLCVILLRHWLFSIRIQLIVPSSLMFSHLYATLSSF